MPPELRQELYDAFASNDPFVGRGLIPGTPLEKLSWSDLERLEDDTLIYELDTFQYLLPRWAELISEGGYHLWSVDRERFGWRLAREKWLQWPQTQVESLRRLFHLWSEVDLREGNMKNFVEFIEPLEEDVSPYFDPWLKARPLEVARWVLTSNWVGPSSLRRWIVSPRVEDKLEHVFFCNPDGEHAELVSNALQLVRALRPLDASSL